MPDLVPGMKALRKFYLTSLTDHVELLNEQMATVSRCHQRIHDRVHPKVCFVPLEFWSSFYLESGKLLEAFFKFCLICWPPTTSTLPTNDQFLAGLAPRRAAKLATPIPKKTSRNRVTTIHKTIYNRPTSILKEQSPPSTATLRTFYRDARIIFYAAHNEARNPVAYDSNHPIWEAQCPLGPLIEANCFVANQDPDHPWIRTGLLEQMNFGSIWYIYRQRNNMAHFNNSYRTGDLRKNNSDADTQTQEKDTSSFHQFAVNEIARWLIALHTATPPQIPK